MSDPDLSLIPLEDLLEEAERRSVSLVVAYQTYADKDKSGNMFFHYGKGNWTQAVALVSILKNDVLNNWNNELKTLQRIAEEGLF